MAALSDWPPTLSRAQLDDLSLQATSNALDTGLAYLPHALPMSLIPSHAHHAPISLFPSLFPRHLFEQAQRLQPIYNVLYARVAQDVEFLDRVMGVEQGAGKADDFTGQLWKGWKQLRDEGIVQVRHMRAADAILF